MARREHRLTNKTTAIHDKDGETTDVSRRSRWLIHHDSKRRRHLSRPSEQATVAVIEVLREHLPTESNPSSMRLSKLQPVKEL
jgi:hypothetical protein